MNDVVKKPSVELVDPQAQGIVDFLEHVGLPSENIIAELKEREIIGKNLPDFIEALPNDVKKDARYLSKFVVGAGVGLFDYALNSIWNEVVIDLRKKAIVYGIGIFFDAAVGGGKNRDQYVTEDDIVGIKDATLLDACRKLELIADTTYTKLKHILDLRNNIGISHPNNYNINAYELLGWLQTCVRDVLDDRPTEAALQVQAFVSNLKTHTDPLDGTTIKTIENRIGELPTHLCGTMLRTVFGMFVAPDTDATVRKNISIIAPAVWGACLDEPKLKLGVVLEGYKANLHLDKYKLGEQFFDLVGGNAFRSDSERLIIISELIDSLKEKHDAWDNFHHEVPVVRSLSGYIPEPGDIIPNTAESLFKVILLCRIGNGVRYQDGVSPGGKKYYDTLLSFSTDTYAPLIINLLGHYEVQSRLSTARCRTHAKDALVEVKKNVISQRLQECLDFLIENIEANPSASLSIEFQKMMTG